MGAQAAPPRFSRTRAACAPPLPEPAPIDMKTRLCWALGSYAAFAVLAAVTLDGVFRYAVWILMAGLAAKTLIAYKAGW